MAAITGSALIALSLAGSTPANSIKNQTIRVSAGIQRLSAEGRSAFGEGRFGEARKIYLRAAAQSAAAGLSPQAATYWNNAGGCSIASRHFRDAMAEFGVARQIATQSKSWVALAYTMTNLAGLYLQMLNPEAAAATAREALEGPEGHADPIMTTKIRFQLASALARSNRFDDALPLFRESIFEMEESGDVDAAATFWSTLGGDAVEAHRYKLAETAFTEALYLVRIYHLKNSASALRGLARVKEEAGDYRSAGVLFDAALAAPPGLTARWVNLTFRGRFLLKLGDTSGALRDFREARRLVAVLRADMVPADQDRVTLESGIGDVLDGLVDAGNTLAATTGDAQLLFETFDAAEQDRAWSLRALIPSEGDWRSKLPDNYWETLARYQSVQRAAMAREESGRDERSTQLSVQLAQMEAAAAGSAEMMPAQARGPREGAAIRYVQNLLDTDTILLSFHLGKRNAWVWTVEKKRVEVFPLGDSAVIENAAVSLGKAMHEGTVSVAASQEMFRLLFGSIPKTRLQHKRWLLELDSALFAVPFGALVVELKDRPVYLIERAAIQTVPGALLLKKGLIPKDGAFVGAGDAVYNTADSRYKGDRKASQLTLARLLDTAAELESCSREWGPAKSRLLTGMDATEESIRHATQDKTAILHFATHVVTSPGDNRTGLLAMSLDETGTMGLLGPKEILAHPIKTALVVMNGCHSAQGDALPGTGLMGLTRAWIGAGAGAVLATQWDIDDRAARDFMTTFYRALRTTANADPATALRQAQLQSLQKTNEIRDLQYWAGYFLLSRLL